MNFNLFWLDYAHAVKRTRNSDNDLNGQRKGQFVYNSWRRNIPSIPIPDEVDCFNSDLLFEAFGEWAWAKQVELQERGWEVDV